MAGRTSYYGGMALDDLVFNIDAGKQESYSKKGIRYMQNGDSNLFMDFAETSKGQSKGRSKQKTTGSIVGATFSNFAPYHLAPYSNKYWHDTKGLDWKESAGIGTFYGNIEFEGINDYIDFGATPEMDGDTDMTVSTWFYVNNFNPQAGMSSMIASRYGNLSANNGWELYYDNQGVLYFGGRESSSEYIYASSSTLLKSADTGPYGRNGGWYNAVGTKRGNTWKLYLAETNKSIVDNVIYEDSTIPVLERSISAGTGTTPFSTNNLILGKSVNNYFNGRIMSLSIYNRALSISEITQNYKSMSKRILKIFIPCPDCIAHDVTIGTQIWTGCNATVSTYRDGTIIPQVTNLTTWNALTTGAWCYYDNDPANEVKYGKLYNWYAVNDPRGLAPSGYHVPSNTEWITLSDYLGGLTAAGGKMKEAGLCHWNTPNTGATNISGFTGLASGGRSYGAYANIGNYGFWWSSTSIVLSYAGAYFLENTSGDFKVGTGGKIDGFSVRFIKDPVCVPSCGAWSYTYTAWSAWSTCATGTQTRTRTANGTRTCILVDCSTNIETSSNIENESQSCAMPCADCVAHDVTIGTQIWTGCNANVSTYRDGTSIPQVTDATAWANLTTGAWCYVYNNSSNGPKYGKLYNWYAVAGIYDATSLSNPLLRKEFAPVGYHVPTDAEWTTLVDYLGGDAVAGGKLKQDNLCLWASPNTGATNTSLFTALPGGYREWNGLDSGETSNATFWTSSDHVTYPLVYAMVRQMLFGNDDAYHDTHQKVKGHSVRFIKDPVCTPSCEAWSYTYTAWSAWSTCATGTQTRTRTANGTRTCILADCSTNIETSSNIESESQACVIPCPDCVAHDVTIGTQSWTGCNANVSTYRDGTLIPYVDNAIAWAALTTGAWCYYNNDALNEPTYGKLYNWYAVVGIYDAASLSNPLLRKEFAPVGYHVPTLDEFVQLVTYLGGISVAGGKMKETGLCHWNSPNTGATNISGFSSLPGGHRNNTGIFELKGTHGAWYSSTETNPGFAYSLVNSYSSTSRSYNSTYQNYGFSVRFIKDPVCTPSCEAWSYTYTAWSAWSTCAAGTQTRTRTANGTRTCILADCSTNIETSSNIESESQACVMPCPDCIAHDVTIGTQTWTGCNANVAFYSNGDLIPQVTDPTAWAALTTGAWCYYDNDPANEDVYGKIYNWYAVNDIRGLAPTGYHVPTDNEWTVLTDYLGGLTVAGGAMKEEGLCHWTAPNTDATNTSLFTGLPGGIRYINGSSFNIGLNGNWWSSTEKDTSNAWFRSLNYSSGLAYRGFNYKETGLSVRFIKDPVCTPSCGAWSYTYTAWSAWSKELSHCKLLMTIS
jgi:uncharacterized protein (TIGR02145 family)